MGARNVVRLLGEALKDGEKFDLASGDVLQFLPEVDDQGILAVGDGTTDMDFKVFVGTTGDHFVFDVGQTKLIPTGAAFVSHKVNALTANTTLNTDHFGGIITNRGAAGAVTLTLPAVTAALSGAWFEYRGVANQNVTVAAAANTLIALNDATATSLAFSTANEKIGAHGSFFCDGTSWFASALVGTGTIA